MKTAEKDMTSYENYCHDNFKELYGETYNKDEDSINEMLDFLKTRSLNSYWLETTIEDVSADIIPNGPMFIESINKDYKLNVSEEAIKDTQVSDGSFVTGGSQFILKIKSKNKNYLMSDIALSNMAYSFIGAIANFKKLGKDFQKEALDVFSNANPGKTLKILYSGEKIRAVQSIRYSPLDQYELFNGLINALLKKVERKNLVLVKGEYSHLGTYATILLNETDLLDEYRKAYNAYNILKENELIVPYVQFNTADIGTAAAKVEAGFYVGQDTIVLGDLISVDHVVGNTVDTFVSELNELFAAYKDLANDLKELLDIKIKNPLITLKNFMKAVGFNETLITKSIEDFANIIEKDDSGKLYCTANDIFLYTHRLASSKNEEGSMSGNTMMLIKENITRSLKKKNWTEYDRMV